MRPRQRVWIAAALALAACSEPREPRWIHLAEGFRPAPLAASAPFGDGLELVADDEGAPWVRQALGAWAAADEPGVWSCALAPLRPTSRRAPTRRLVGRGARFEVGERTPLARLEPECASALGDRLFVRLAPDATPAADLVLETRVARGREQNGRWCVEVGSAAGEGLALLSGSRVELTLDVPPASALRFATVGVQLVAGERATFAMRVRLDGELAFEHAQSSSSAEHAWHRVALPAGGRRGARLAFEVDGPSGLAAFVAPIVGPTEVGRFGARPFGGARADVVLFVADTFRADLLRDYGSPLELCPQLEAFAERALTLTRARSPSTWTLPAHASMFTALHPLQHAALGEGAELSDELVTLAEELARHGWRTGAVSEGALVSAHYGLAQGFEWFHAERQRLEDTLARACAFLDADDGRPTFLFVHTYRVHTPYEATEHARRALARLRPAASFEAFLAAVERRGWSWKKRTPIPEALRPMASELFDLYRAGARDLDRGFGRFQAELEVRGLGDCWLVFTSDHGEEFAEHGVWEHGLHLYEEVVRVPLLVRGPGVEPRRDPRAASLVDLPATIAAMAGIAPARGWLGRSLLAPEADRPIYSFRATGGRDELAAAAVGSKKLIVEPETGVLREAYDLAADPRELHDVARAGERWPAELLARVADELRELAQPLAAARAAQVGTAAADELEALGYTGD